MKLGSALILMLALVLGGCVSKPPEPDNPYFAPVPPQAYTPPAPVNGSIYNAATSINLYGDGRASRVGDILTIVLKERTQSSKSAETDIDKSSSLDLPTPTFFGRALSAFGNPINAAFDSDSTFESEGSSDMSNSLSGNITVTVHEVRPNGTLLVRGEKWLTLNQGDEYLRLSGIVRERDIGADNTVASTKLADARISYSGTGAVHNSNITGWLGKFFLSPLWLF